MVLHSGVMVTPGARIRQERTRQRLTQGDLAARAKISIKTLQRIERDERYELLHLVEEALGLPSSADPQPPAIDEAEMLRRVPHRRFWLEAARRAEELADFTSTPPRGQIADIPETSPGQDKPDVRNDASD